MKNLLFLILLVTGCKSLEVTQPFTYRIKYIDSNQVKYTNKVTNIRDFRGNIIIYKFINGKYLKLI